MDKLAVIAAGEKALSPKSLPSFLSSRRAGEVPSDYHLSWLGCQRCDIPIIGLPRRMAGGGSSRRGKGEQEDSRCHRWEGGSSVSTFVMRLSLLLFLTPAVLSRFQFWCVRLSCSRSTIWTIIILVKINKDSSKQYAICSSFDLKKNIFFSKVLLLCDPSPLQRLFQRPLTKQHHHPGIELLS